MEHSFDTGHGVGLAQFSPGKKSCHDGNHSFKLAFHCAVSSVVEHHIDTVGVRGSNPLSRTININENDGIQNLCTDFAQNPARPADKRVKFPVTIRHRSSTAKIYAPAKNFAYYRMAYTTAGKRQMQTFPSYSEARQAGERIVRALSQGSQAASLTASQSRDALAALERLTGLYQSTGRKYSLLGAASELAEIVTKLRGRSPNEAVDGYLQTVVIVKPERHCGSRGGVYHQPPA